MFFISNLFDCFKTVRNGTRLTGSWGILTRGAVRGSAS